jgi:hypothetical protein
MAETLRLFVSATSELEAERALIGRTIAELPVQIGIEIRRSPVLTPTFDEIFEQLATVDRVYFLMGNDIMAPAGLEWNLAWRLERRVLAMRRAPHPTPAAQEFFRLAPLPWLDFRTAHDLARMVSLDLAQMLKHPANRYGLTVREIERLERHVRQFETKSVSPVKEPGGAEGGGVLLDAGHREPLAGVLLND